ncbi:MAG: ABC transporter permease [Halanaerobiales bacterium]
MEEILQIGLYRLIAAYIFVLILILIAKYKNVGHQKQIVLASFRMTIQLVLVGYLLTYIFDSPNPLFTIGILAVMEVFAVFNIYGRVQADLSMELKKKIAFAMAAGTLISIFYFILIIINLRPWFHPQYFIPISGMLIGNSMTGISLGVEGLINGIKDNRMMIENALMLGASPEHASREVSNRAFYNAILPTLNSMMGMGIVFLPGMMTGHILAGAAPLLAIKYQIAIMMGILGSVTLTVYLLVKLGTRSFFNERAQIVIENDGNNNQKE